MGAVTLLPRYDRNNGWFETLPEVPPAAPLSGPTEADVVVVGIPYSLDGSTGPMARKMGAEADELAAHLAVPVETYDERLTTVTAERRLAEQGLAGRRRRALVDQVAASVILQAWLDIQREVKDR